MAHRRKSAGDGGFGLILVLLLMALGVIVTVLAFLFQLAVTAAFYALPLAVVAALVILREVGTSPPALPDPASFDDAGASHTVAKLLGQQDYWARRHQDQYDRGSHEGLNLTKGSGETRFDTRGRLGRELNANLEVAEAALLRIAGAIDEIRLQIGTDLPAWRSEFDIWTRRYAVKLSILHTLLVLGGASLILYVWSIARPDAAYAAQAVLLWDPLPARILISPLVGAALLAYAAFPIALKIHRRQLLRRLDGDRALAWQYLEAKWSLHTDVDDFFDIDHSDAPREEARSDQRRETRQTSPNLPWHEVLGVSAAASEAEIKTAYREAIKGYHSDRVASLGPKLRALAEEESKRLNVAYDEARKARQFR